MPLIPSNFAANSLTGSVRVSGGYANIILTVSKYAFEDRTKSFTLKLRRDSAQGPVIAQSNLVTLTDFSEIVSLTANTSTVAEGNLVALSLVTANVINGANVFFSVLPMAGNVTSSDFLGANAGVVTINNNQGTIVLYANADYSLTDEAGEIFRVQLRTNDTSGNIVFASSNIAITDFFKRINVFGFVESVRSILEGTSVTFTISAHNIATGTLLYYYTTGNAGISGSNTGSVVMNSVSNTITITTSSTVPSTETRTLNLILSETNLGTPIATSNTISVVDTSQAYMNATGGTVSTIDGFRIHTFTSSNTFSISNFATATLNTANVLVVAGGGGGSIGINDNRPGGAGGGGGFVSQTSIPFSSTGTYTITVGAGGAGLTWAPQPSYVGANGGNSTITAAGSFANVIAVGGGGGGGAPYGLPGRNGGSGGGGYTAGGGYGFPSPTQQGFPGGSWAAHPQAVLWQGGGGAGGVGLEGAPSGWGVPPAAAPTFNPFRRTAFGGPGANSNITGANVTYAGGGGGGNEPGGINDGGSGGGGYSSYNSVGPSAPSFPAAGVNGTVNRGGGGGAGWTANAGSGGSGIIIIRYPWRPPAFFSSVTANSLGLYEGTNVSFIVNTTFANAVSLFYDTVGNVTSSNFVGGNTGSFTITSNATVLTLQTIANIPENESRNFALRIREDSVTGNIVLVSSNVGIFDDNQNIYVTATGGNVFTVGGFRTHIFTASNTFAITDAGKVGSAIEYYMVAGGAGGITASAPSVGGGGGAGGVLFGTSSVVANTYVVTVGAGGAAGAIGAATNGGNTSIVGATTITPVAAVGGGVGGFDGTAASVGGSGGGGSCTGPGARTQGAGAYGSGTFGSTLQGFAGGEGAAPPVGGGGGGGSGGAGTPANNVGVGNAGPGSLSPLSSSIPGFFGTPGPTPGRWFAGGGGGGGGPGRGAGSAPVTGGGGEGGGFTPGNPGPGTGKSGNVNTGGGAGSSATGSPGSPGGTGGSGIVVIRYPFIATPVYTSVTTANTLINEGANVTFTIRTENANANVLFYTTVGNVISADFVGGNTGSFTVTGDTTTLTLSTTTAMPADAERTFQLQVRRDSTTGPLKLTSNTVYVYGTNISVFIAATGGNVFTSGGFRTHIFTDSNTFVVTNAGKAGGSIEYFMVAGGGGGGIAVAGPGSGGAGGGAGGVLFGSSSVVANSYVVTIGGGGAGNGAYGPGQNPPASNGGNTSVIGATVITNVVAVGGGGAAGGGDYYGAPGPFPGRAGGSGGGGDAGTSSANPISYGGAGYGFPGTIGSTMQGFPGGTSLGAPQKLGTGGGGAGARAANVTGALATPGGIGISSPLSSTIPGFFGTPGPGPGRWFAGGGGGGGRPAPAGQQNEHGLGGAGGGGRGGDILVPLASAGNVNTGGGGGGGLGDGNPAVSRSGGSGIVIIRYPFA